MVTPRVILAPVLTLLLTGLSCGPESKPAEGPRKLKIYYFWNTSGDPNQHSSIKTGVEKAKEDPRIKELENGPIDFKGLPDPESSDDAIAQAHELRRSPDTLAVIGHTYSGTTWSLLPAYAEAGIPVIVTNATSPYLFHEHGEKDEPNVDPAKLKAENAGSHFSNAFRLIASDIPDQANAIQLTIRALQSKGSEANRHSGPARVMLICDETSRYNTKVYSKPMCDYLARDAMHRNVPGRKHPHDYSIVSSRSVDLDHADLWGLITEIHATDPQYIVLIGYSQLALDVIQGLTERATPSSAPKSRYKFIMTDAAFGSRRRFPQDLDIFITSPARPHSDSNCNSSEVHKNSDTQAAASTSESAVPETTEAFAYDAVMILADSVSNCRDKHQLDRNCVLEDLRERQGNLSGSCGFYDLHEGELQNANYYVYSNRRSKGSEPDPNPKWCARSQDEALIPFGGACGEPTPQESSRRVVGGQHR